MLEVGITNTREAFVTANMSALAVGSGDLEVYATPCMIALMEKTAYKSVEDDLMAGQGTVGTLIDIEHLSPTPIGMKVSCTSELVEIDGRKLVFDIKVYDGKALIGRGRHERFIIDKKDFIKKANGKLVK